MSGIAWRKMAENGGLCRKYAAENGGFCRKYVADYGGFCRTMWRNILYIDHFHTA